MTRPQQNNYRKLVTLDGIWNCAVDNEDIGVREQWFNGLPKDNIRPIAVPASWNEQYRDLFFYFGKLWYAHTVHVDDSFAGHNLLLHIGSACNTTEIWINGQNLGRHATAHLPVSVDISPHIYLGSKNLIVLCVDGTLDPWGLPPAVLQSGEAREGFFNSNPPVTYDFYPYAGIHRSVTLLALPSTHIENVRVNARPADDTAEIEVMVALSSAFRVRCVSESKTKRPPILTTRSRKSLQRQSYTCVSPNYGVLLIPSSILCRCFSRTSPVKWSILTEFGLECARFG